MGIDEEILLLKKLSEGDQRSFESLYLQYRQLVYTGVWKLMKCHDTSQEILQDVFVKVWQNRAKIDTSKSFRAYLYTISQSTVYDYFRRIASDQAKVNQFSKNYSAIKTNEIEEQIAFTEVQQHLDTILESMPERCRQVFVLCKIEGRSYDEVAKLLNISTATINNHIVKATRIIKSNWTWEYYTISLFFLFFQ